MENVTEKKENTPIENTPINKRSVAFIIGIVLLLILFLAGIYGFNKINVAKKIIQQTKATEEIKSKAEKFINETLLPPGMKVNIKNVAMEGDLYNLSLEIDGKEYTSYMTKDGKKFFQSGIDIEQTIKEVQDTKKNQPDEASNAPVSKTDKPNVELFVMSHCPYGTQIEKGILPVVETLKNKIDFTLKFCDYAMHGEKELNEQLTQYCIQKNEKNKLNTYLSCFLKNSDSASCLKSTGIDIVKNDACVKSTDEQYSVTKKLNDKSAWTNGNFPPFDVYKDDNAKYNVEGSPVLIINGSKSEANRDSASLLTAICSAFNNPPAECNNKLSSAAPAPGFGEGTANSATSGSDCAAK
ncbi:MAG: hypothetical protein AAB526_02515 [Patescibacteria group bacterium]